MSPRRKKGKPFQQKQTNPLVGSTSDSESLSSVLTGHQQEDQKQPLAALARETDELRLQLEAQGIEAEQGQQQNREGKGDVTMEEGGTAETTATSRKRPLEELLQQNNSASPLPLKSVNQLRLEAIFHPKFENESDRDRYIRDTMIEKVGSGQGYLEVSLKHSGSLLLWSGGQRYYSKNSTDNKFTHVGEILLRQHFVRAFWKNANDSKNNTDKSLEEEQYQECSNYVEQHRLTLAFEAVTSVLGDHGDRPKRDFLILTAVADRNTERFYSTLEVVELAQRFRLPHNDFWEFSSSTSVQALFQFYDSCRETSLAGFVQTTLSRSAETVVKSLYPHIDFQGDILEGIVIRYVSNKKKNNTDSSNNMDRMKALADVAKQLCTEVPSSVPDCFALVENVPNCPPWLSVNLRKVFAQARFSNDREAFAKQVEALLGTENRRHGKRLPKAESNSVPSLLRALQNSSDSETRRIAKVVQTLHRLNIRVDYSVVQEEISLHGFSRWLCIVHVILDFSHQKYRKQMDPGDLPLFRGFALELSSSTGFSANVKMSQPRTEDHSDNKMAVDSDQELDSGSDSETGLMIKMKFLPYMVRTFGCRNGLRTLRDGGVEGFVRYTSGLLSKWKMSQAARKKWMPFFRAWAEYASPRLAKRLPEDRNMAQLTSDNYLEHLERFISLYDAGKMGHVSVSLSFAGFCVVVGPTEETAKKAADTIADHVGCKVRFHGPGSVPKGTHEGLFCSASVEDRFGRLRNLIDDRGDAASLLFVGCSDEDIAMVSEGNENKARRIRGCLKGWRKLRAPLTMDLPLDLVTAANLDTTKVDCGEGEPNNKNASLPKKLQDAIAKIRGTAPQDDDGDAEVTPGLLVFFPQIPGCGKSSLVDEKAERELKAFLTNPKRNLKIRMGDKTPGKFWPLVKKEKKDDPSNLYIADKNVPALSWDLIGDVCGETSAIGVPVLPGNALETTVVKGIRWPNDGQVSMNRTQTFPFSLRYLAVCILRVVSRPPNTHPGKLDCSTARACMIVVMFFCLYEKVSADEFMASLANHFEKHSAFLVRKPVEVPFFRSNDDKDQLPEDLRDLLIEAIRAQLGYNTKGKDVGKVKDAYLDDLESRLRKAMKEHGNFLKSLTVEVDESHQSFVHQVKEAVAHADSGDVDIPSFTADFEEDQKPKASRSKEIRYVSINVSPDDVHCFLLEHENDPRFEAFWGIVSGGRPVKDVFLGSKSTESKLTKETHVTLAHKAQQSQEEMVEKFGPVEGHSVDVVVTALLWDASTAALEAQLPGETATGSVLPASKNKFAHITLWCQEGTKAFRSNELPGLVEQDKATRISFDRTKTFHGKIALQ